MKTSLVYDYPLRPDFLVQLVIPSDLTVDEARRIGAFLQTLAVDAAPEIIERIARRHEPTPTPAIEHL